MKTIHIVPSKEKSVSRLLNSGPGTDRVELIEKKPYRMSIPHVSDEDVIDLIRRHKKGVPFKELAKSIGKCEYWVRAVCAGANRGHLLRMVEEGHSDYRMGWKHKK